MKPTMLGERLTFKARDPNEDDIWISLGLSWVFLGAGASQTKSWPAIMLLVYTVISLSGLFGPESKLIFLGWTRAVNI